jgi:hypothetical protein
MESKGRRPRRRRSFSAEFKAKILPGTAHGRCPA